MLCSSRQLTYLVFVYLVPHPTLHRLSNKIHLWRICAPGTVPGIGFIVVDQADVVPTLQDLKVELGRDL